MERIFLPSDLAPKKIDEEKYEAPFPMALLQVQYVEQGGSVYKILVPHGDTREDTSATKSLNPVICQVHTKEEFTKYRDQFPKCDTLTLPLTTFMNLSEKFKTVKSIIKLPVKNTNPIDKVINNNIKPFSTIETTVTLPKIADDNFNVDNIEQRTIQNQINKQISDKKPLFTVDSAKTNQNLFKLISKEKVIAQDDLDTNEMTHYPIILIKNQPPLKTENQTVSSILQAKPIQSLKIQNQATLKVAQPQPIRLPEPAKAQNQEPFKVKPVEPSKTQNQLSKVAQVKPADKTIQSLKIQNQATLKVGQPQSIRLPEPSNAQNHGPSKVKPAEPLKTQHQETSKITKTICNKIAPSNSPPQTNSILNNSENSVSQIQILSVTGSTAKQKVEWNTKSKQLNYGLKTNPATKAPKVEWKTKSKQLNSGLKTNPATKTPNVERKTKSKQVNLVTLTNPYTNQTVELNYGTLPNQKPSLTLKESSKIPVSSVSINHHPTPRKSPTLICLAAKKTELNNPSKKSPPTIITASEIKKEPNVDKISVKIDSVNTENVIKTIELTQNASKSSDLNQISVKSQSSQQIMVVANGKRYLLIPQNPNFQTQGQSTITVQGAPLDKETLAKVAQSLLNNSQTAKVIEKVKIIEQPEVEDSTESKKEIDKEEDNDEFSNLLEPEVVLTEGAEAINLDSNFVMAKRYKTYSDRFLIRKSNVCVEDETKDDIPLKKRLKQDNSSPKNS